MIAVIVSYPNGERDEVILAGIPRVGESIRMNGRDPNQPAFIVEHVIWTEGGSNGRREAEVIVTVRKRTDPP